MINLLPKAIKSEITYAKRNTALVKWLILVIISIVGLYGILGIGYFYLHTTAISLSNEINNDAGEFNAKEIKQIEADTKQLETSVNLARDVISRQLLFSKLLTSMGNVLPGGTKLAGLDINETDQAIDLRFNLTSKEVSAQLAANLGDPTNGIFSKFDVINVDCDPNSLEEYSCSANARALFADNSTFRFDITDVEQNDE